MFNEDQTSLPVRLRELAGILFKYELMFSLRQSGCKRLNSFPFSSLERKSKWSCLEMNGDKTDKI